MVLPLWCTGALLTEVDNMGECVDDREEGDGPPTELVELNVLVKREEGGHSG